MRCVDHRLTPHWLCSLKDFTTAIKHRHLLVGLQCEQSNEVSQRNEMLLLILEHIKYLTKSFIFQEFGKPLILLLRFKNVQSKASGSDSCVSSMSHDTS